MNKFSKQLIAILASCSLMIACGDFASILKTVSSTTSQVSKTSQADPNGLAGCWSGKVPETAFKGVFTSTGPKTYKLVETTSQSVNTFDVTLSGTDKMELKAKDGKITPLTYKLDKATLTISENGKEIYKVTPCQELKASPN